MSLTEDQRQKIEENRRKAIQKRAEKHSLLNSTNEFICKSNNTINPIPASGRISNNIVNIKTTSGALNNDVLKSRIEQNRQQALERLKSKISPPQHSMQQHLVSPPCKVFTFNKQTTPQKVTTGSINVWKSPENKSHPQNSLLTNSHNNANNQANPKPRNNATITSFYGNMKLSNAQQKVSACTTNVLAKTQNSATKQLQFGSSVRGSCKLVTRERFEVIVNYHPALVEIFKTMKSKSYDLGERRWTFLLEDYSRLISAARVLQPDVVLDTLPKAILKSFSKAVGGVYSVAPVPDADLSRVDSVLVEALMHFQRDGVNFGVSKGGRLLLADDMGLGKTIQALCLARYYRDDWPMLVVSPSSVRFDWAQQIKRWLPSVDPDQINVVTKVAHDCTWGLVNIVSYDIMSRQAETFQSCGFRLVIMDECHMLKNIKSARTKAALPILRNARRVILLSGTPALSRPCELYTQIQAICPGLMSYNEFGQRYCDGKQQTWGWDFSGSSNLPELQLLLEQTLMIRRLKCDVLKQLPPKIRQVVQLDPQSIKDTKDLQSASSLMQSKSLKGMERRGILLEYFHQSGKAKLSAVKDYIKDMIEGGSKLLVFAHHREMLDSLEDLIQSKLESHYIRIDGRTSSEQRKESCDLFQSREDIQVALLSITAANAGLNLSAAVTVIFAELFWNPGILMQAEDRAHRIGQQDSVNVHYLVAPGTADDYIWPLIQTKLDVLGKAGLAKDNFSDSNSTHLCLNKALRQNTIEQYFEESFIEDVEQNSSTTEQASNNQIAMDFSDLFDNHSRNETPEDFEADWLDDKWDIDMEPQLKKQKV